MDRSEELLVMGLVLKKCTLSKPKNSFLKIELKKKFKRAESLRMLLSNMHSTQEEIDNQKGLAELEPLIKEVIELYGILKEKRAMRNKFSILINDIKNVHNAIVIGTQKYEELHSEFERDFPPVCPLCNK